MFRALALYARKLASPAPHLQQVSGVSWGISVRYIQSTADSCLKKSFAYFATQDGKSGDWLSGSVEL